MPKGSKRASGGGGGRGRGRGGGRGGKSKWQARDPPTQDVFGAGAGVQLQGADRGEVRRWKKTTSSGGGGNADGDNSSASGSDTTDGGSSVESSSEEESQLLDGEAQEWETSEEARTVSVKLAMWEMNQNDTRRDTGSKLCRFGDAQDRWPVYLSSSLGCLLCISPFLFLDLITCS